MARRMYDGLSAWMRPIPGRLLHSNIWTCSVFAAICGSSMATAAAVGDVAFPEQVGRLKYSKSRVLGSIAGGGTLGILIPPSLILIMYGVLTETSIARLYLAGFIPGVMMAIIFSLYIIVIDLIKPWHTSEPVAMLSFKEKVKGLGGLGPPVAIVIGILAMLYLGVASPSELGAVGALLVLIINLFHREVTWSRIVKTLVRTARISSFSIFLILGGSLMSILLANIGTGRMLISVISEYSVPPYVVFAMICGIYFVLGCFLDGFSILVLVTPLSFVVLTDLGFDPVWFGIIVTLLTEIGIITPPYGINLYVLDGISGGKMLGQIMLGALPYVALLLFGIGLLVLFPEIALSLPNSTLGG